MHSKWLTSFSCDKQAITKSLSLPCHRTHRSIWSAGRPPSSWSVYVNWHHTWYLCNSNNRRVITHYTVVRTWDHKTMSKDSPVSLPYLPTIPAFLVRFVCKTITEHKKSKNMYIYLQYSALVNMIHCIDRSREPVNQYIPAQLNRCKLILIAQN